MIPTFAVVGRSNRGKSSIVATLTENDQIPISPLPRTTTVCQSFTMNVDGKDLFTIIDTPGFEEAPAVLEWLNAAQVPAPQRAARVAEFVKTFSGTDRFRFECELLRPIITGASILYVVDASHPYRPTYEAECEILRWTGQPSLALINRIGDADHVREWEQALNQFFKKVVVFDAHKSLFEDRIALLEELRFLNQELRPHIELAIDTLQRQRHDRTVACATIIAGYLRDAITHHVKIDATRDTPVSEEESAALARRFQDDLRRLEEKMHTKLARQMNFTTLDVQASVIPPPLYGKDLFGEETRVLLGIPRENVIMAASLSGGMAGAFVDAHVGGASLFLGSVLGAVAGGAGAFYFSLTDPKIHGISISKKERVVQLSLHDYPWILLDRAIIFYRTLLSRTHAVQDRLEIGETQGKQGPSAGLSVPEVGRLLTVFRKLRKNPRDSALMAQLARAVEKLLPT